MADLWGYSLYILPLRSPVCLPCLSHAPSLFQLVDLNLLAVMSFPVIKCGPSDSLDGPDLSSLSPMFFTKPIVVFKINVVLLFLPLFSILHLSSFKSFSFYLQKIFFFVLIVYLLFFLLLLSYILHYYLEIISCIF